MKVRHSNRHAADDRSRSRRRPRRTDVEQLENLFYTRYGRLEGD